MLVMLKMVAKTAEWWLYKTAEYEAAEWWSGVTTILTSVGRTLHEYGMIAISSEERTRSVRVVIMLMQRLSGPLPPQEFPQWEAAKNNLSSPQLHLFTLSNIVQRPIIVYAHPESPVGWVTIQRGRACYCAVP